MRGAAPPVHPSALPGASRQTWLLLPPMGAPPHAPGDFLPDEKVTKESPRGGTPPLGTPLGGRSAPPAASRNPLDKVCATKIDRSATLGWWANRSCFFLWFHQGNTLCFQSVARQGCPRGCLKVSVLATNTARAESRGNPRGSSPLCRRSRNQEVPGVSLPTFSTRESRPGHGAERP